MKSFLFLSLFIFCSAQAEVQTELKLEAEVGPEIKLTRVDGGGDLDLFGGNVSSFQVEANTTEGVDITIQSANKGVAKHVENSSHSIKYTMSSRINNEEWHPIINFPTIVEISSGKFVNRRCQFSLKSEAAEDIKKAFPGIYRDDIFISIKSHS